MVDFVKDFTEIKKEMSRSLTTTIVNRRNLELDYSWGTELIIPKDDESLQSWIIRQAIQFNLTPKKFLEFELQYWKNQIFSDIALSSENKSRSKRYTINYFIQYCNILIVDPTFIQCIARRGLSKILPLQFQFPSYIIEDEKYNKKTSSLRNLDNNFPFIYRKNIVICFECFISTEYQYFKLKWLSPLIVTCSIHRIKLEDKCQNCHEYLFSPNNLINFSETRFHECHNCGWQYKNHLNKQDPQLLQTQNQVIYNMEFNLIDLNNTRLLFGIKWKKDQSMDSYIEFVKMLYGFDNRNKYENRPLSKQPAIFEIYKYEQIMNLQNNSQNNIRNSLEIDKNNKGNLIFSCFIINCDYKIKATSPQGRIAYKNHLSKIHYQIELKSKICKHCGLLIKENKFDKHYEDNHQQKWFCTKCDPSISFDKRRDRDIHYRNNHRIFNCGKCDKSFDSEKDYQRHFNEIHKEKWTCGKCKEVFGSNYEYRVHYNTYHKEKFNCSSCSISFNDQSEYLKHYNKDHRNWYCKICKIDLKEKNKYRNHFNKNHKQSWGCDNCNHVSESEQEYKIHYNRHKREHKCTICNITFNDSKEKRKHTYVEHELKSESWKKCSKHNVSFDTIHKYRYHWQKYHQKEFTCKKHKMKFDNMKDWKRHKRKH